MKLFSASSHATTVANARTHVEGLNDMMAIQILIILIPLSCNQEISTLSYLFRFH